MKKSLLALAAMSAIAGAASAQTSVTIYGVADVGMQFDSGNAAGSVAKLSSGIERGSRLGFKGTEDLGGGLNAIFTMETGIALDAGGFNQSNTAFARQAFVGLQGGFGTVAMGRQYNVIDDNLCGRIDPFGCGLSGTAANLMSEGALPTASGGTNQNGSRMNNSIKYTTPALGGFYGSLMYGFGEQIGDNSKGRTIAGSIGYENGPLTVFLAHQNQNYLVATTDSAKNSVVGVKYDFGVAAIRGAYQIVKNGFQNGGTITQTDARNYLVGVSAPFGPTTLMASYIKSQDKTAAANDANQVAIGVDYALSKRTNLYASYARISNTVTNASTQFYTVGNAIDGGTGDKSLTVGVRHTF